jgi:integrase
METTAKVVSIRPTTEAKPKRKRRMSKLKPTKGSIRERFNAYHWEYYLDGKHKTERLGSSREGDQDYLPTKQAAVDEANRRHAQRGSSNKRKGGARTGTALITEYWKNVYFPFVQEHKRPSTQHGYNQMWSQHLEPHFVQLRLCDYEPYMATEFLTGLAGDGKHGKNTISHVRGLMSGIFKHAISLGHLRWNPIAGAMVLGKVKKKTKPTESYSVEEMQAILRALDCDEHAQDHAIFCLAFFGVRPAEQMGAMWEDVDWEKGGLHIQRTAWNGEVSDGAKNENSVGTAWFSSDVMDSLRRWKRLSGSDSTFIFGSAAGTPLVFGSYQTRVQRAKFKKLGLPWKALYSGRRSSVTDGRRFGRPEDVARQHRHSVEVANKAYDKGREDLTRQAMLDYGQMLFAQPADNDTIADK